MRYRTIRKQDESDLIYYLNESVKDGYIPISTGASFNTLRGVLEWWAILGRDEKTVEKPKDDAAELLEAAKKIAKICKERADCLGCPFANEAAQCRISNGIGIHFVPESWPIIREG